MASRVVRGWRVQTRVVGALMIRELNTRFGRENIGFLWILVEPLMFAILVGLVWRLLKGPEEYGIGIIAFIASGYLPLQLFRNSANRAVGVFHANSSLMYHRQVKVLDLVFVRFLIEFIGHTMAYVVVAVLLIAIGEMEVPADLGFVLLGWSIYGLFTLSVCLILAPLSAVSEMLEKVMPVTVYVMIPFSGTFTMVEWLAPSARGALLWSPPVHGMEMMRYGLFGALVTPHYEFFYPIAVSVICMAIGLVMCRRIRRTLIVE